MAVESVDFRKGIDSLAELCRQKLDAGIRFRVTLFVFRSRRATSIKVLVYDLCVKRRVMWSKKAATILHSDCARRPTPHNQDRGQQGL